MYTTANTNTKEISTPKAERLKVLKRAKFLHKNSENPKFVNNPINVSHNVENLLSEKINYKGKDTPKVALLFKGNVKFGKHQN